MYEYISFFTRLFEVVIREIHNEQALFEQAGEWGGQFKNAKRLLAAGLFSIFIFSKLFSEADKLENSIDPEWLEVDIPKPIKVTKKILIPTFRHPRVIFSLLFYCLPINEPPSKNRK